MIKRILAIFLSLTFIFSIVGCNDADTTSSKDTDVSVNVDVDDDLPDNNDAQTSSKDDPASKDNNSASQNSSTSSKVETESLKGKTVKILMWRELTNQEKKTIEKFKNETSMNVSIETTNWSNYMTKLASMVSTGDSPDVAIIPTEQSSQGCFPLGTATLFQPISVAKQDLNDGFWDLKSMEKF